MDGGGDCIPDVKIFKLYPVGREARSWGNIEAYWSLESQSTAQIFLVHKLKEGIPNASMAQSAPSAMEIILVGSWQVSKETGKLFHSFIEHVRYYFGDLFHGGVGVHREECDCGWAMHMKRNL